MKSLMLENTQVIIYRLILLNLNYNSKRNKWPQLIKSSLNKPIDPEYKNDSKDRHIRFK